MKVITAIVAPLILGSVVACTAEPIEMENNSKSENSSEVISIDQGTGNELITITSDNVSAAGYNADTKVMTVRFDNGSVYEYFGVDLQLWKDFLAAQPHPWSRVGYPRLVKGGFPYKKVN